MNNKLLNIIIFFLAFCSIVYELIFAQALSAFLENTVLRYSVTIGLYMFALGWGALMAEGRMLKTPSLNLLRVEILLTLIGGFSVMTLHTLDMIGLSRMFFILIAHALIIIIGLLSGMEIPLLMALSHDKSSKSENRVLAINYLGAFAGTVVFAYFFFPKIGLMPTALTIGLINAVCGMLLWNTSKNLDTPSSNKFILSYTIQSLALILIAVCYLNAAEIDLYFLNQYVLF